MKKYPFNVQEEIKSATHLVKDLRYIYEYRDMCINDKKVIVKAANIACSYITVLKELEQKMREIEEVEKSQIAEEASEI